MISSNVLATIFSSGGGGKTGEKDDKKPAPPSAPKDYTPSTAKERGNWNQFLDFLESKGVGGSTELDKRDRTRGLELLNEFNKANPKSKVDPSFIPRAQYESIMIRKQQSFPGLTPEQSEYAFANLSPQYRERGISEVDNWLGSQTSKQYYPTYEKVDKNKKIKFNTDFEAYLSATPKEEIYKKKNEAAKPQPLPGGVAFLK